MTEAIPAIALPSSSFAKDFECPFVFQHQLTSHPLFTLSRMIELLRILPRDQIEFNSGKVRIGQDPNDMPVLDMSPEEIIDRIETANAWMVLKRVEIDPAYKAVLEEALGVVARQQGYQSLGRAGFQDVRGFLFVSSPNSITPLHLDAEDNLFVQIKGEKLFSILDNRDNSVASYEAIEKAVTQHRNLPYDRAFEPQTKSHQLFPGDGVFVPYLWPHWVQTKDQYSISLAITWKTKDVIRRNDLFICNSMLRRIGFSQAEPGKFPRLDSLKSVLLALARTVVAPLRKLEGIRRVLRRAALGRGANYYLRATPKRVA